ncbi:MAG: FAD:protein FMN transferase [Clostridiaceae bacterium]|nr:FAD:protein FMN transferase [Clostridiaceae bacterium]
MKKITAFVITLIIVPLIFSGCRKAPESEFAKYSDTFFGTFDTLTQVVGYTKSEQEFKGYFEKIRLRFEELHKLYDIYNDYEGMNNIKTINDNAGVKPVKVDKEIIGIILFAKDWYGKTGGRTNIAMGAVLSIWHDYREQGEGDPQNAKLPSMEGLREAEKHTDINKIIVDEANSTVYLADSKMSLDVGAIAKGFAAEIVAKEMMAEGFTSGIISPGGNIRIIGKPLDGVRERWGIGIQDPDKMLVTAEENLLDTIFVNNASVVSSGDYQRYYVVDGNVIHHLIDPDTLMPGEYYRAVTVVTEDSGLADFLSTTAFLLPYDKSRELLESIDGAEAVWIMPDGKVEATDGMKRIMKSHGATGAEVK